MDYDGPQLKRHSEWMSLDVSLPRILLYLFILVSSVAVTDLIEQPLADRLKKFSDQIQLPGRRKRFLPLFAIAAWTKFVPTLRGTAWEASVKKMEACWPNAHKTVLAFCTLAIV